MVAGSAGAGAGHDGAGHVARPEPSLCASLGAGAEHGRAQEQTQLPVSANLQGSASTLGVVHRRWRCKALLFATTNSTSCRL